MALLNLGDDPWLKEFDSCEKLYREIMEQLNTRQQLTRRSDKYNQISSNIRLRLKQYNSEVSQLNLKLESATSAGLLTTAESERRNRQLELLHSKSIQLQNMFDEQVFTKARDDRNQLLGQSSWENDDLSNLTVDQLQNQQRQMLGEQEQGLESLSQIIARQKNIAQTISTEVDLHNEIIDDLGNRVDHVDARVRNQTQHISIVDTKDNTCIYWVIIILLFISIVIVAPL